MFDTKVSFNHELRELRDSAYEIADGQPDIRNWKVIALRNQDIGKVGELLFDEISQRVRYIVVEVNGRPLNLISRSVLVPIGMAELLQDEKLVLISDLSIDHLVNLPTYEKGKMTRDMEFTVRNVLSPGDWTPYPEHELYQEDTFYNHAHFNDGRSRLIHPESQKNVLKEELKENIQRVKETVRKMEDDVKKLNR
jgi:hypothetical protein